MNIRPAQPRDLELCLSLDPSYETDHVWQMESTRAPGSVKVGFRVTRLPRTMKVAGIAQKDVLLEHYEQGECFLIAEENDEIRGYIDATGEMWKRLARINYLTVAQDYRRSGIAKALVRAMLDWGHTRDLDTVIAETQTKNYPASSLFLKLGFAFCGFNDHYYTNRDIAIFFALTLH
jgi:ribosomal protein S18 acetylase RimI-like enzyme